jgi:hypothetical protein
MGECARPRASGGADLDQFALLRRAQRGQRLFARTRLQHRQRGEPRRRIFYLKLLARRDALAKAGDGAGEAARADAAETDAAP